MENPDNLEFKKKFESVANIFDEISNPYTVSRRAKSLQQNVHGLLLEVGSATGQVTCGIDAEVICTDISVLMCMEAKKNTKNVVCCDAEKLPFKENVFDAIIAAEIIYYLKHPDLFFMECNKTLKKRGKIHISMVNPEMAIVDKLRAILRKIGFKRTYFDDGIKHYMKLEHLHSLLKKHNFEIISTNKEIIFPFKNFDKVNCFLERTFFNRFGMFIFVKAQLK